MDERVCLCSDPENCTQRVPGYRCKKDFMPTASLSSNEQCKHEDLFRLVDGWWECKAVGCSFRVGATRPVKTSPVKVAEVLALAGHITNLTRSGKSYYIRENSLRGGASAWAELLEAVWSLRPADETTVHPERHCERCRGPNVTWFVASELWNAAHGVYDILCPVCFVQLAEAAGIRPTAWQVAPESNGHETKQTPSHDLECEHPPSFQKTVTTNSGTVTVCETCSESRFTPWQAEKASDDRDDTPEHLLKQGYRSGKVGDSK